MTPSDVLIKSKRNQKKVQTAPECILLKSEYNQSRWFN